MKQNKCPWFGMVGCSLQGVLAQAKNGDELLWEVKFHATNGKAQACIQGALLYFPFKFGDGEGIVFHFPLVPNVFPLCSRFKFAMGSQYIPQVPNMFTIAPHFYPICFGKCCPPFS